jgi:predicted RNA binding protein YcfA (HicA-like mRNA interferase family)
MSVASSVHFLNRDVIFIFKLFKLKTEGHNSVARKGLHFVMKAGDVSVALYGADDCPLFTVKLIVRGAQPHQISYLHHAYSIAREGLGVKRCLDIAA